MSFVHRLSRNSLENIKEDVIKYDLLPEELKDLEVKNPDPELLEVLAQRILSYSYNETLRGFAQSLQEYSGKTFVFNEDVKEDIRNLLYYLYGIKNDKAGLEDLLEKCKAKNCAKDKKDRDGFIF